jgi:hypothetical protein
LIADTKNFDGYGEGRAIQMTLLLPASQARLSARGATRYRISFDEAVEPAEAVDV